MSRPLKVLIVEDNPEDAELVILELHRAGFAPDWRRVDSEADFAASLRTDLDIILSDFSLPDFSGLRALEMLQSAGSEVPFILISGTIGEDIAVAAMKLGAADYLIKDRLGRLGRAVEQALEQARLRRERTRTEHELTLFRTLMDQSNDTIEVLDPQTARFLDVNAKGPAELGFTREEFLARRVMDIDPTINDGKWPDLVEKIRSIGFLEAEGYRVRKDGTRFPVEVSAKWVTLDRDYIIAVVRDITVRRKQEQQLLRAQRLQSIGTLAGGIAHDLNNVLSPIMMSLAVLKSRFPDPASDQLFALISSSAQRGADMVRQVLSFAQGVEGRRIEVSLTPLIREIGRLAAETFPANIRLEISIPEDLRTVPGDPTQLHQVLLNLCVNARDAMPDGGTLALAARNFIIPPDDAVSDCDAPPGQYVILQVEDNGTGMTAEVRTAIFDPFFTTKGFGQGTGLGLSNSLAIVRSHGGFMQVASELGKGSQFTILLPAWIDGPSAQAVEEPAVPQRGNGELILVVDDEASIREITRQTLEIFGYRVVVACGGAEAAAIYGSRGAEISVLLIDMTMPGMDGAATIQVIQKLNPAAKIIAVSGFATDGLLARLAGFGVRSVLAKPYNAETLLTSLREILAANPSA